MEQRTISQLTGEVLAELEKQHYARISIVHFQQAFDRIESYSAKSSDAFLSEHLIKGYLLDRYGWDIDATGRPSAHITSQLRAIRILKIYEESGHVPGRISEPKNPPACFGPHYDRFISECTSRNLSDRTIESRSADVYDLLAFAKNKGASNIYEIGTEMLDTYMSMRSHQSPGAMPRILSSLRCFFRCMFASGAVPKDLSFFIPPGSRYPTKPVQKLWTNEEVNDLLSFLDRSDAIGKRDYALILLVLRYGMRKGDILNLKLTDIHWGSMTISFCQEKTSAPNVLPILDDVGWALADWITHARPKQAASNHVFTRLSAPYGPLKDLANVLKKHMTLAGISSFGCGKSGPHSLRHALASNMLAGQVPLPVISSVLGHSSSASTMVYLHSDVEGLRQCALDIEEGGL